MTRWICPQGCVLQLAPCTMRSEIDVYNNDVYLCFHISSMTSLLGARCAAVLTNSVGHYAQTDVLERKWFHGITQQYPLCYNE